MEVGPKLCLLVMTKKSIFMTVLFKCLESEASGNPLEQFQGTATVLCDFLV